MKKILIIGAIILGSIGFSTSTLAAISEQQAKDIALKEAQGGQITKFKLDRENGRMVYEGEIYHNGWEYEFDIDAVTGAIVKWKVDGVSNNSGYVNNNVNNSQTITMEKAKSIALAQVPGANQSHFGKIDLDYDHGRAVYEIEIFYNNSKYEFDIDASTGEIIGTEVKHYNKNY